MAATAEEIAVTLRDDYGWSSPEDAIRNALQSAPRNFDWSRSSAMRIPVRLAPGWTPPLPTDDDPISKAISCVVEVTSKPVFMPGLARGTLYEARIVGLDTVVDWIVV